MLEINELPDENAKRLVAVLNKKVDIGRLLNALGHMTSGLIAQIKDVDSLCFLEYKDMDGGVHPSISHYPFIVLRADNSNKIRKVRNELIQRQIPFTDFIHTMIIGTSEEQLKATSETEDHDLEYFGICMFGNTSEIKDLTKTFSLFK
ncbi:hypothetical protein Vspart_04116 [Vibrio spartinae]|uniref:DUF2000 domain-containing protein n=1 Tax=Vibrio spartinae TaxID=1918945 RepID=A0ABX6R563_9VIBR|nr:hypothetical protein Vspart_04116 [Vibrio spartinae]